MSDFLKLLKECKISAYSGYYIKVKFNDRLARDLFLCQVMNQANIKIPEISYLFAPNNNRP